MGRVGSEFLSAIAGRVGSGRVNVSPGRVGSGPRKVTRGQLCAMVVVTNGMNEVRDQLSLVQNQLTQSMSDNQELKEQLVTNELDRQNMSQVTTYELRLISEQLSLVQNQLSQTLSGNLELKEQLVSQELDRQNTSQVTSDELRLIGKQLERIHDKLDDEQAKKLNESVVTRQNIQFIEIQISAIHNESKHEQNLVTSTFKAIDDKLSLIQVQFENQTRNLTDVCPNTIRIQDKILQTLLESNSNISESISENLLIIKERQVRIQRSALSSANWSAGDKSHND